MCGVDAGGTGQWPAAGCCEHGYEPSGPIKGGKFLDYMGDCLPVK
jgi:hypothetical protein